MKSMLERIQYLSESGVVERFHTRPGIKPDTDAAHSWEVAMMCSLLTDGKTSRMLLMAALTHDMGEVYACDMSSPAKRALGLSAKLSALEDEVRAKYGFNWAYELTEEEDRVLNLADNLAGMLRCCRERALGNLTIVLTMGRWLEYVARLGVANQTEREVLAAIVTLWRSLERGVAPSFDVYEREDVNARK